MTIADQILVREAAPADAPAIAALLSANRLGSDNLVIAGTRYWLAARDGACVGAIGLELGDRATLLRSAIVAPELRGHGLGARLVRACLAAAVDHGPAVYLFSTEAGPYWQRFGFVEVAVDELVNALPAAPQVLRYRDLGWLPTEVAWKLVFPQP